MDAILSSLLWVPRADLDSCVASWQDEFTTFPKEGYNGDDRESIVQYAESGHYIGLPYAAGMEFLNREFPGFSIVDRTCFGGDLIAVRRPDAFHEKAAPGQNEFRERILHGLRNTVALMAQAGTGSGKTPVALWVAAELGRATLVIVTSITLAHQWADEAKLHLGLKDKDIGIVQAGNFPFQGRQLVIAIIHNLIDGVLPAGFANYFGLIVWDEVHRMGAREFCKTLPLFPAAYKLGLTATPKRKDGCMKVVTDYFGSTAITAEQSDMETACCVIYSYFTAPPNLMQRGLLSILLRYLSKHPGRNKIIINAAMDLYRRGRKLVVMSDRVEHLHTIQEGLIKKGVSPDEVGFYTGFVLKGRGKEAKKIKINEEYHRKLRESTTHRVILGTYAQMKEGVNIPWLDAGIDAIPQADGIQTIGRVRRPVPGKPMPVWITIVDENIPLLKSFAIARLQGYRSVGVTVYEEHEEIST